MSCRESCIRIRCQQTKDWFCTGGFAMLPYCEAFDTATCELNAVGPTPLPTILDPLGQLPPGPIFYTAWCGGGEMIDAVPDFYLEDLDLDGDTNLDDCDGCFGQAVQYQPQDPSWPVLSCTPDPGHTPIVLTDATMRPCRWPSTQDDNVDTTPQDTVVGGPGSFAEATWSIGGSSGLIRSDGVDGSLSYRIRDCPNAIGDCLYLADANLELSSVSIGGIDVDQAVLSLFSTQAPAVTGASFSFEAGSLRALLMARIGDQWTALERQNVDVVSGTVNPSLNNFTLTELHFDYSDTLLEADLHVNINGEYANRAPRAAITVPNAPHDCSLPVAFVAASGDYDGDAMTHTWWSSSFSGGDGTLYEPVLPEGTHIIRLTSTDTHGRWSVATLNYARSCH
ncbi:MAG: hypothetical protein K0V04_26180 [Deltaproteobacteria bacterium]|nr:hypothetical protein [Deltaproteobacteria bacterium]